MFNEIFIEDDYLIVTLPEQENYLLVWNGDDEQLPKDEKQLLECVLLPGEKAIIKSSSILTAVGGGVTTHLQIKQLNDVSNEEKIQLALEMLEKMELSQAWVSSRYKTSRRIEDLLSFFEGANEERPCGKKFKLSPGFVWRITRIANATVSRGSALKSFPDILSKSRCVLERNREFHIENIIE